SAVLVGARHDSGGVAHDPRQEHQQRMDADAVVRQGRTFRPAIVSDQLRSSGPRKTRGQGRDNSDAQDANGVSRLISALTKPGDLIVDPFATARPQASIERDMQTVLQGLAAVLNSETDLTARSTVSLRGDLTDQIQRLP